MDWYEDDSGGDTMTGESSDGGMSDGSEMGWDLDLASAGLGSGMLKSHGVATYVPTLARPPELGLVEDSAGWAGRTSSSGGAILLSAPPDALSDELIMAGESARDFNERYVSTDSGYGSSNEEGYASSDSGYYSPDVHVHVQSTPVESTVSTVDFSTILTHGEAVSFGRPPSPDPAPWLPRGMLMEPALPNGAGLAHAVVPPLEPVMPRAPVMLTPSHWPPPPPNYGEATSPAAPPATTPAPSPPEPPPPATAPPACTGPLWPAAA